MSTVPHDGNIFTLCNVIRLTSLDIHRYLRSGFTEKIYEIEKRLICEIKGCNALIDAHTAQLLGYLRAARIEHGLLINFGGPKLEIKKYILT